MKEEGIFKFLKKELVILIVIFMVFIPLPPVIVTDIFISINTLLCMLIFLISIHIKRPNDVSLLSLLIIFSALLNMYINISVTLHILYRGDKFEGQIIYNFFTLINNQEYSKIITQLAFYIIFTFIVRNFFLSSINGEFFTEINESIIENTNNTLDLLDKIILLNCWIILIILLRSFIVEDLISFDISNDGLSVFISSHGFLEILNNLKIYISYVIALGCNSLLHSVILILSVWYYKRKIPRKEENTLFENENYF